MDDQALRWEYRVITIKNTSIGSLQQYLNAYGVAGWEVISLSTTVKTMLNMAGNDLVIVMKRPSLLPADRTRDPKPGNASWWPDPTGRHELRWFDGKQWTNNVSDDGSTTNDPLDSDEPPADLLRGELTDS